MLRPRADGRIPVVAGSRIIEFAGPERVRRLLAAPNVRAIRRRKDRAVVEIQLVESGDDTRLAARRGNPQELSHCAETDENPPRVWTLKELELVDLQPEGAIRADRRAVTGPPA